MKKLLLLSITSLVFLALRAQPFGNEWIDPARTHYKIKVVADGIYRINYSTLAAAIPNIGSLNPQNLVMYHNGLPVPIFVSNNSGLGTNDYIEFFGKRNTGFIDSLLYRSSEHQINPNYSLFTDTSVFFLTTNNLQNNPRFINVINDLTNLPPREDYFLYFSRLNYPCGAAYPGKYYSAGTTELYKSLYDEGEAIANCNYFGHSNQNFTINTPFVYTQGPNAIVQTYYTNHSRENHDVIISLNGVQMYKPLRQFGFKVNRVNTNISTQQLISGANTLTFVADGIDGATSQNQNMVGGAGILYPREFNFGGADRFYFEVAGDPNNSKYLEISNFNDNGTQPLLYDLTNGHIYNSSLPSSTSPVKYHLLLSGNKRDLYLRANNSTTYTVINEMTPVNFVDYQNLSNQGDYFIISNSLLFNDGSGNNWVEEYRKYRDINDNPTSGKFQQARIADIEVLYDQFGYGIRKSPLAIRNFIRYGSSEWVIPLTHVFLIGKAREYITYRGTGTAYNQTLVPTFGSPGSDNLLASSRNNDQPLVAIGRLAAQNGNQVKNYLTKMKEYESQQNSYAFNQSIPEKLWQKQLLHFSGGTSSFEQVSFKSFVESYRLISNDTSWGTRVNTFTKNTNAPIDQSVSQIIKGKINEGVSWLTFFGHSATGAFDFSIDEPENYTNQGKYPIILSNGCFSGFIHDASPGYSERFVLPSDRGAIAFMATSSLSVSSGLHDFSSRLYQNFCRNTYTQTLGKSLQRTLSNLYTCCSANDYSMLVAYEMTLHGDPAISVNQYPKPDYAIDASSVYFNPTTIMAGNDSFEVNVVVTNLGRAIKDSITVSLTRTLFDERGNAVPPFVYKKIVDAPYYRDTVTFKLPINISTLGYGQNLFEPYVDADFEIDEMAEGNNGLTAPVSINIQSDDIIPIYPYEFAIVPKQGVTLKASTINPFARERNYKFEIDTSEKFSNPIQSGGVFQSGGVVHWKPTITYQDSTVYYWRVGKDSSATNWHYSSFIYLKDEYPGWNQSHYFQWKKDTYFNLRLDSTDRIFKFPSTLNQIHVKTGIADAVGGNIPFSTLGWDYNNSNMHRYRMGGCGFLQGITFAVIDPVTGANWVCSNVDGDNYSDKYGSAHCGFQYYLQNAFDFNTTGTNGLFNQPWSTVIKRFIDSIPCNYYVLVYSSNSPPYTSWDNTLVTALESIGMQASLFKNGTITGPFVYFTKKCDLNFSPFFAAQNGYTTALDTSFTFLGPWNQGNMTSPRIGPAVEWGSAHWKTSPLNNLFTDVDTLDIIGVSRNGFDSLLISTTQPNILFNNSINAYEFPYLKLRLRTRDDSLRTPTQPLYWRILYKKPPEAAINPAAHFKMTDSTSIGQNFHLEIALENVTEEPMDSMLTKYILRDATFNPTISYIRSDSLPGLDTMILVYDAPMNSNTFLGLNKVIIEANPDEDQVEQYHFNNIAEITFQTGGDKINPLLDVTFDSRHIMNGDIVSSKPNILITLKDENKFLALNDTSLISVFLKYPGESSPRQINFDDVIMTFFPADSSNLSKRNVAQVELKPTLPFDGTYELIVRNHDRSNNNSSTTGQRFESNIFYDYKTSFEVINKAMITNVLNYPNPFTTSTQFVFTITGSEVPDFMKIQIMTIKGTVVKEIMKEELGPLHVGRNMTTYTWNGRDQYGDLLANGVYFYRVVVRIDDKQMEHLSQGYDKYFKKGFGKMVIIR
ncbi:MAG: hypothetical protein IPP77_10700 [Bacteroidetes bacterium]|nr:hypothetical protein [Bacteroidota bacterium]